MLTAKQLALGPCVGLVANDTFELFYDDDLAAYYWQYIGTGTFYRLKIDLE